MGKASKRMKRRQAQKAANREIGRKESMDRKLEEKDPEVQAIEERLEGAYGEKKYSKALEILAELVDKTKNLSPEHIFMGAKSYFEIGDYDRAAQWITNTLTFAPAHVEARLLLARICMMKNRAEDGMAILNLLLADGLATLSEVQQEAAKKLWLRYGEKAFLTKFPNLSALDTLPQPAKDVAESVHQAEENAKSDVKDLLRRLKEKVSGKAAGVQAESQTKANAAPEAPTRAEMPTPAAKSAEVPTEKPAAAPAPQAPAAKVAPAEPVVPAPAAKAAVQVDASNTADVIASVRGKGIPRAEKLRILNAFAGAAYLADDCRTAEEYLSAALTLDAEDEATLKNAVYNAIALGEIEKAEAFAARMRFADFAVLDEIRAAKGL